MNKIIYLIIILLISSCSSVSKRDNYFANETIYNYLIENEVDLQSEKDVSDEVLCFFSFSPDYVVNLINQPEKLQEEIYNTDYRYFDYLEELAVKNLLGGFSDETRPDQDRLAYGLKELNQIAERWKNEVLNRNIVNNCKRSVVDSFSTALNNYSPKEADGISFKNEYNKKLINFFSTVREYNKYTNTGNNAGESEFLKACSGITGIAECGRPSSSSVWVFIKNSNAGHNYGEYGQLLCDGGESKYNVPKGYVITFWDVYNKDKLYKYKCF